MGTMSSPCAITHASAICAGVAPLLLCKRFNVVHQIEILIEIVALETRMEAAKVVLGDIFEAFELAGEEPAAERAIGHKADSEFANRGQNVVFRVAGPQRILGL